MGILRLLLAFSVLVTHLDIRSNPMLPGEIAVQLFYIISGFYMAMILTTKYSSNTSGFFKNRFLRLYPIYFSILIIIFLVGFISELATGQSLNNYRAVFTEYKDGNISLVTMIFVVISNLSMLFQDLMMFLKLRGGMPVFGAFANSNPPLYTLLYMPQAWSLSLEITFYAIAPWIVKSKKIILIAISVSLAIRVFLYSMGLYHDPYSYRFFGSELSVFLLGSLSYHLFTMKVYEAIRKYILIIVAVIVASLIFWEYLFHFNVLSRYIYFCAFAALVPYIFQYFKDIKSDSRLGELSYPFYLIHIVAISLGDAIIAAIPNTQATLSRGGVRILEIFIATAISLLISVLLINLVQKRVDRLRKVIRG